MSLCNLVVSYFGLEGLTVVLIIVLGDCLPFALNPDICESMTGRIFGISVPMAIFWHQFQALIRKSSFDQLTRARPYSSALRATPKLSAP